MSDSRAPRYSTRWSRSASGRTGTGRHRPCDNESVHPSRVGWLCLHRFDQERDVTISQEVHPGRRLAVTADGHRVEPAAGEQVDHGGADPVIAAVRVSDAHDHRHRSPRERIIGRTDGTGFPDRLDSIICSGRRPVRVQRP
jgi:hypothetical protein